jgi:hypothetical protein
MRLRGARHVDDVERELRRVRQHRRGRSFDALFAGFGEAAVELAGLDEVDDVPGRAECEGAGAGGDECRPVPNGATHGDDDRECGQGQERRELRSQRQAERDRSHDE